MTETILIAVLVAVYFVLMFFIFRYAIRRHRENQHARRNGWRCVGGNFITGPLYVPPEADANG